MEKFLLLRFISDWPSLYRSRPADKQRVSTLQQQREIVSAMTRNKAFVLTEAVKR